MDTERPQPGDSRSKSSRLAGATSNTSIDGRPQERSHKLIYRNAANVATKNITQDAHLKIVHKTGSSQNKKQHAVGYEYMHIKVHGRQLTVKCRVGVCREICDQFVAARNGKPP